MADQAGQPGQEDPQRSRPRMPEDYRVPQSDEGMLQWSRVRKLLEEARTYWISTTRPDGKPHAVPVWGAWVLDRFYCDGHPQTRWARNLDSHNPAIVVHIESEGIAIMVEGVSEDTKPDAEMARLIEESFEARYNYKPDIARGIYNIRPIVAFAWDESLQAATRWQFTGS